MLKNVYKSKASIRDFTVFEGAYIRIEICGSEKKGLYSTRETYIQNSMVPID